MRYSIEDLSLLSLHDSNLESATRGDTTLELIFDWAKLTHLAEENIAEPVILGQTTLLLTGVREEAFKIYEDEAGSMRAIPPDEGVSQLRLILTNELLAPDSLVVTGLLNEAAGSNWAKWCFTFMTATISWKSFITRTEWLAGKLPNN